VFTKEQTNRKIEQLEEMARNGKINREEASLLIMYLQVSHELRLSPKELLDEFKDSQLKGKERMNQHDRDEALRKNRAQ
jgi:uncharacterized membrane protein YvbJ